MAEAVEAVLHVAAEVEEVGGRHFDGTRESSAHPQACDPNARTRPLGGERAAHRRFAPPLLDANSCLEEGD